MTTARDLIEQVLPGDWHWMDHQPTHPLCQMLDRRADIDAVVFRLHGVIEWVSFREQPNYEYDTLTIRYLTDKGNQSQWHKILRGISLPSWYVHIYAKRDVYGWMVERGALRSVAWEIERAGETEQHLIPGKDGQLMVAIPAARLTGACAVRLGKWPDNYRAASGEAA